MFLGKDHRVKKNICLICNHQLDGATQVNGDEEPKLGDVSICIECGNIALFDDNLGLRQPTIEEEREILKDPNISFFQTIILKKFTI